MDRAGDVAVDDYLIVDHGLRKHGRAGLRHDEASVAAWSPCTAPAVVATTSTAPANVGAAKTAPPRGSEVRRTDPSASAIALTNPPCEPTTRVVASRLPSPRP